MIRKRGMACSNGLMVASTMANGTTESSMVEAPTCLAKVRSSKAPGKMEREPAGSTNKQSMINECYS
jgi:hypothetical protein